MFKACNNVGMRRRLVILLMLSTVLFQALFLVHGGASWLKSPDLMHSVLHWMGQAHEHDGDGSWQIDDSAAASQHVVCDPLSNPAVMPSPVPLVVLAVGHDTRMADEFGGMPNPHLEGPLRPPRRI